MSPIEPEKDDVDDVGALFVEAARGYTRTNYEITADAQQRTVEAARELARAIQAAQQQGGGGVAGPTFVETLGSYPNVVLEAQQRWTEAVKAYEEALRSVSEQVTSRHEETFRTYIADLKKAWAQVDPSTIEPATTVAIQQAMLAAACVTG